MEKGLKMTIKVSKDTLEKLIQGDKNHPETLYFEEENDTRSPKKSSGNDVFNE